MIEELVPKQGEEAPDFTLVDSAGREHRLSEMVARRPLTLVFYRGHW